MRLDHLLSKEEVGGYVCHCPGIKAAGRRTRYLKVLAAMRMRDTPVPIPNTTVKTHTADGTALETARESRRPPELKERPKAFTKKGCMAKAVDAP